MPAKSKQRMHTNASSSHMPTRPKHVSYRHDAGAAQNGTARKVPKIRSSPGVSRTMTDELGAFPAKLAVNVEFSDDAERSRCGVSCMNGGGMRMKSGTDSSFFGMGYRAGASTILVNCIITVDTHGGQEWGDLIAAVDVEVEAAPAPVALMAFRSALADGRHSRPMGHRMTSL
jgi:hypothetical protein